MFVELAGKLNDLRKSVNTFSISLISCIVCDNVICSSSIHFEGSCDLYFHIKLESMNQKLVVIKINDDASNIIES